MLLVRRGPTCETYGRRRLEALSSLLSFLRLRPRKKFMICGRCGRDINPGCLTCPGCQATYGRMVAGWGIAMFVPLFLLLFVGLMATGEGLTQKHSLKVLTIGILCLAAAVWILWMILKKSPRGWRQSD